MKIVILITGLFGLGPNAEYMRNAGQLHTDCLELLNKCLKYTELPSEGKNGL